MEIRCNLKELMDNMGMKQRFLANKVGISERTMSFIIRGKSIPTLPVALKIAEVMKKSVEEIWIKKN